MNKRLEITMAASEGALIRVLGTVERRGYSLNTLHVEKTQDHGMQISMDVESDRDANILCRQLGRLYDVQNVHLQSERDNSDQYVQTPRFQASWL
jgi:acetolactate synthase II small subunit